jgi:poly-gamma-glutamate synthesis protein (capsule biosynthesis protein)
MTAPSTVPATARELFAFKPHQALFYKSILEIVDRTGLWRYPAKATGDIEEMRLRDLVYWLYKCAKPIQHAERGSGLETFFEKQKGHRWRLPDGFRAQSELRLSAVGDLMNHAFIPNSGESLYREVRELIFGADVTMANLECVVNAEATGQLEFTMGMKAGPPLYFQAEEFRVVSGADAGRYKFMATACNHSLDFGAEGVRSTICALRDSGIAFHGMNETEASGEQMTVIETGGVRLGLVAFTFGLNAHQPPGERPRIVNRMRLNGKLTDLRVDQLAAQLRHGREAAVDFVVAHLHWGMEFEYWPRPSQLEVAHHLAEMGVDAIIGHHPHVVQPVEYYSTRRDPDRVVPIFYSLGNLTNPFSAPFMCRSGVARLDLVKGVRADGSACTFVKDATLTEVDQVADHAARQLALRRVGATSPRSGA